MRMKECKYLELAREAVLRSMRRGEEFVVILETRHVRRSKAIKFVNIYSSRNLSLLRMSSRLRVYVMALSSRERL